MRGARHKLVGFGMLAAFAAAPAVGQDQEAELRGLSASVTIGHGFRYSDNFDLITTKDGELRAQTDLGFELSSRTRRSDLRFTLSTGLENFDEVVNPRYGLFYNTRRRSTRLSFSTTYSRSDVNDSLNGLVFDLDTGGFLFGDGLRTSASTSVGLETGLDAPFGMSFRASQSDVSYSNTTNPLLFDTDNWSAGIEARMDVSRILTMTLGMDRTQYTADDLEQTRRYTTVYSLGANANVRPGLTATAELSYSENETVSITSPAFFEGAGLTLGVLQDVPNGTVGATVSSTQTITGRQTTAKLQRSLALRDGALSFSFGVLKTQNASASPIMDIGYERALPGGALTVDLSQRASVDVDNQDIINSTLQAVYSNEINAVSSWEANLGVFGTSTVAGGGDRRKVDLGLTYRHEVARDWDFVSGYTHSRISETGTPNRSSNTVFLKLEKTFQLRP